MANWVLTQDGRTLVNVDRYDRVLIANDDDESGAVLAERWPATVQQIARRSTLFSGSLEECERIIFQIASATDALLSPALIGKARGDNDASEDN